MLAASCERLVGAGTRRILVWTTHGLFTGSHSRLWDFDVTALIPSQAAIHGTDALVQPGMYATPCRSARISDQGAYPCLSLAHCLSTPRAVRAF